MRWHTPTFCGECEDEIRNNEDLLVKGSYFLTTEGAGTHDLVFGYDTFDDIRFAVNHQTGSDFTVYATDYIVDGNNNIFPGNMRPCPRPWRRRSRTQDRSGSSGE